MSKNKRGGGGEGGAKHNMKGQSNYKRETSQVDKWKTVKKKLKNEVSFKPKEC